MKTPTALQLAKLAIDLHDYIQQNKLSAKENRAMTLAAMAFATGEDSSPLKPMADKAMNALPPKLVPKPNLKKKRKSSPR